MWVGDKIYYSSDKDDTLNLYSYDPKTKKTSQLTHSAKWDVRWPSTDHKNRIIYEMDGELNIFDIATGKSTKLAIDVPTDALAMRPSRISAAGQIEWAGLSPKGERALFVARGDVFTAPIEKGATRNLTNSSNAHDKFAQWSPDGAKIAFISDMDGEDELYLINQDGSGKPEELTHGFHAMLYQPSWAPDGKHIAFGDKDGKLYVLTLEDKKVTQIAQNPRGRIPEYPWSEDGGHLAYTMDNSAGFTAIYVWSVADGQSHQVTDYLYDSDHPAWDPEGNYLYFISTREYAPQLSRIEFNFATNRGRSLLALTLRKDGKNPYPPESDEVTISKPGEDTSDKSKTPDKKDEKKEEKKKEYMRIDFDGLADRVTRVPADADNFTSLVATKDYLVYERLGAPVLWPRFLSTKLRSFSLIKKIAKRVLFSRISMLLMYPMTARKSWCVRITPINSTTSSLKAKSTGKGIATDNLMVDRVPQQEWVEIFNEVARRYRDFFYVQNMHGYDWDALRAQYRPLVDYVAHRSDLNYVLGEMVAELSVSHAYIAGGDYEIPKRPQVALPGARIELDAASGRYRLAKIYRGQNEEELYRSPLTKWVSMLRKGTTSWQSMARI